MTPAYHVPVLYTASLDGLAIDPAGTYVDVTFGGGGHSRGILEKLGPDGRLLAFDCDPDAAANAPDDPRFTLIPENFRYIRNFLRLHSVTKVDGILADLGVSSHQFDTAERGFSIREDGDLDMRMDPRLVDGADTLLGGNEAALTIVLRNYGELPRPHLAASGAPLACVTSCAHWLRAKRKPNTWRKPSKPCESLLTMSSGHSKICSRRASRYLGPEGDWPSSATTV
jgi:16S rRNA (cytosine(1402)-N(4))-methyltransferase